MGLLAFGLFAILVLAIAAFILWVAKQLAPQHPDIFDKAIWVLAVVIIVWQLAGALGLHDVQIPKIFG